MVEEVLRLLQVDETHRLAVFVFADEDEAVGGLFVQVADQVRTDAFDAFVSPSPVGQREIHEAGNQAEDEIVIVFGEANQVRRFAHGVGRRYGDRTEPVFLHPWR